MRVSVFWMDVSGLDVSRADVLSLLSERRKQKLRTWKREEDIRLCAGAELALVLGMSELRGTAPAVTETEEGKNGKPVLKDGFCHINMSHSGDISLCAFCEAPVGADVEAPRMLKENIRRRVLSSEEVGCPSERLLHTWVEKEAYLKLTGEGITRPMTGFFARDGMIRGADGSLYAYLSGAELPRGKGIVCVCTEAPAELVLKEVTIDRLAGQAQKSPELRETGTESRRKVPDAEDAAERVCISTTKKE